MTTIGEMIDAPPPSRAMAAVKQFACGAAAGVAQCISGHPFDTVKVKLQTQTDGKYKGMVHAFRTIIADEGALAVYRGVQSPLIGMAAMNSVVFASNSFIKTMIGKTEATMTTADYFKCGAGAGLAVAFVEGPVDLGKCQLQTNPTKYKGLIDVAGNIWRTGGIRGVYQGLSATLLRNVPANSLYFGVYEYSKTVLDARTDGAVWKLIVSGGFGGIAYWGFTYPQDIIKTTMQSEPLQRSQRKHLTFMGTARALWAQGGAAAFMKGFTPCMARSVPANAATFLTYELVSKHLGVNP